MKKAESKKDPNDDITEDDIYNIERRHSKLYEQSSYGSYINSLNLVDHEGKVVDYNHPKELMSMGFIFGIKDNKVESSFKLEKFGKYQ
jgi:hypothetical protein